MSDILENIFIEIEEFVFEAPAGFQVVILDEYAELIGPNDEVLVVSLYSIDPHSSEQERVEFINSTTTAMTSATDASDLITTRRLTKATTDEGLPVWSVQAEAVDKSHFFDQYAISNGVISVLVSIEGDYVSKGISTMVEEAVYTVEFK